MATSLISKWCYTRSIKRLVKFPRLNQKPTSPSLHETSVNSQNQDNPLVSLSSPNNIIANEDKYAVVFRHLDSNQDGKISSEELSAYFASMGETLTREEAQRAISEFNSNGNESMEYEDFVQLMERDENMEDDLKRAFEMFQLGDKGCGCITPNGLQYMFKRLGNKKTYEECVNMISAFDLDGNGVIDFNEFQHMMAA